MLCDNRWKIGVEGAGVTLSKECVLHHLVSFIRPKSGTGIPPAGLIAPTHLLCDIKCGSAQRALEFYATWGAGAWLLSTTLDQLDHWKSLQGGESYTRSHIIRAQPHR